MKIEKCTISIKCDANGCHEKATEKISFDGETYQLYLCGKCFEKLKKGLNTAYGGLKNEKKK